MKLRIHGNSLRLRLSQSEVAQFSKTGFVEDSIQFAPGASFAYALESMSSLSAPQACYSNGWLRIQVPGADGHRMGLHRIALASRANSRSNPANACRSWSKRISSACTATRRGIPMPIPTRLKKLSLNRDREEAAVLLLNREREEAAVFATEPQPQGAVPKMEKGADIIVRPSPRRSESTLEL